MNKYGAKKTVVGNIAFASRKEAKRYQDLSLLLKAGQIENLALQVPFEIIPAVGKNRPSYYVADFVYWENGQRIVEDAKGFRTRDYQLKKKLMRFVHGIEIKEV